MTKTGNKPAATDNVVSDDQVRLHLTWYWGRTEYLSNYCTNHVYDMDRLQLSECLVDVDIQKRESETVKVELKWKYGMLQAWTLETSKYWKEFARWHLKQQWIEMYGDWTLSLRKQTFYYSGTKNKEGTMVLS